MEEKKYGKAIGLREHQLLMLDILSAFADFCDEHQLQYFLDAGTLLGAVRHQGFIPWDNDVDVCMLREDYERFCSIVRGQGGKLSENLYVEFPEDTIYPFLKIVDKRTILIEFPEKHPMETGVYIDLFCKVGLKDDSVETRCVCKACEKLALLHWFNYFTLDAWGEKGNTFQKLVSKLGKKLIVYPNAPILLQDRLISWYAAKYAGKNRYLTTLSNGEFKNRCKKECFEDYVLLPFEGKLFKAPVGYKEYLPCLYPGDYMQLPPVEDRRVHKVDVFWKSEFSQEN